MRPSDSESVTWLSDNHLKNETKLVQYFYAFYWSTVTIMTVGYGDISATNTTERFIPVLRFFSDVGYLLILLIPLGRLRKILPKNHKILSSLNFKKILICFLKKGQNLR